MTSRKHDDTKIINILLYSCSNYKLFSREQTVQLVYQTKEHADSLRARRIITFVQNLLSRNVVHATVHWCFNFNTSIRQESSSTGTNNAIVYYRAINQCFNFETKLSRR